MGYCVFFKGGNERGNRVMRWQKGTEAGLRPENLSKELGSIS